MCLAGWPELVSRTDAETRSRVGKSQWVFRLSLCLVDFTAMVFRHVLLAASFFGAAGNELGQQILASSTLKFAFFGNWQRQTQAIHSVAL